MGNESRTSFYGMFKNRETAGNHAGRIILDYTTPFESAVSYILLSGIIIFITVILTSFSGDLWFNPDPYVISGLLLLAGVFIRFNLSAYVAAEISGGKLLFEIKLFAKVFCLKTISFTDIVFLTIGGFRAKASGILNDYCVVLVLRNGRTLKLGNAVWWEDVHKNIPAANELARLLGADFIDPVMDKKLVVLSRPVTNRNMIGYEDIRRRNSRGSLIILAVFIVMAFAALITAFIINLK